MEKITIILMMIQILLQIAELLNDD